MKNKQLPDIEELNKLFEYDPETGAITNKIRRGARAPQGADATSEGVNGYRIITIKRSRYYAHRIIWKMSTGEDPGDWEMDHINRYNTDNRLVNLRLCTRTENNQNREWRDTWSVCTAA